MPTSTISCEEADAPAARKAAAAVAISIIVPCWRGDAVPQSLAESWLAFDGVCEVVVASAEGGEAPAGKTVPGLRTVCCGRAGRGHQMNEAARLAGGNVLLFQHADTELTGEHLESLCSAISADQTLGGGAFRRRFDERHPRLRWIEPWEALRCRRFGPLFGDQSIFVRREVFDALGGFADVPLMEDVDFSCRMRRRGRIALLSPSIRSSARKHIEQGAWRTTLTNALFLFLYVFGVSPVRLHAWYYRPSRFIGEMDR